MWPTNLSLCLSLQNRVELKDLLSELDELRGQAISYDVHAGRFQHTGMNM